MITFLLTTVFFLHYKSEKQVYDIFCHLKLFPYFSMSINFLYIYIHDGMHNVTLCNIRYMYLQFRAHDFETSKSNLIAKSIFLTL